MMQVDLKHQYFKWQTHHLGEVEAWFSGTHPEKNRECIDALMQHTLKHGISSEQASVYTDHIRAFSGYFALILRHRGHVVACVDHVRSMPLFYRVDSSPVVTDSAMGLLRSGDSWNQKAEDQFLQAGYTLLNETLVNPVFQLQAASVLIHDGNINIFQHFRYHHPEVFELPVSYLVEKLQAVYHQIFERLKDRFGNQPIVVPLSGGLDSRLLALLLKEHGFQNVTCFYYGQDSDTQKHISQNTAGILGFDWKFVRYSKDKWSAWFRSKEFSDYRRHSHQLCSLPHIDDWPALCELKKENRIREHSVIMPGHTGDFISSGHLKSSIHRNSLNAGIEKLMRGVIDKHLSLSPFDRLQQTQQSSIRDSVISELKGIPVKTLLDIAKAFEYWEWQNRQAKYIINAVRVYDFFGYEWYLPFWEKDLLNFWMKVPPHLKISQTLYRQFISAFDQHRIFADQQTKIHKPSGWYAWQLLKNFMKQTSFGKYWLDRNQRRDEWMHDTRYGIFKNHPGYISKNQRHVVTAVCRYVNEEIKAELHDSR